MLTYKLKDTTFHIKSGWHEITFAEYLKIYFSIENDSTVDLLQILTDLPIQLIIDNQTELVLLLQDVMNFVYEPVKTEEPLRVIDISTLEIGRFIDFQKHLTTVDNTLHAYSMAYAIYFDTQEEYDYKKALDILSVVNAMDCEWVLSMGKQLVRQYNEFYKLLIEPLTKAAFNETEAMSGIEDFMNKWGFYATMHFLCKGDIFKFDKFVKQPASKVYTLLNYLKDENDYKKALQEVITQKQKVNGAV